MFSNVSGSTALISAAINSNHNGKFEISKNDKAALEEYSFNQVLLFNIFCVVHSFIGSEKIAQMLIKNGANVNAVDAYKNSALAVAASTGQIKSNIKYVALRKM